MPISRAAAALACALLLVALSGRVLPQSLAADDPAITAPRTLAFVASPVTIAGTSLGDAASARSIEFRYENASTTLTPSSPAIVAWDASSIELRLPPEIHSGTFTVTVDGRTSAPAALIVLERLDVSTTKTGGMPLASAIGPDGKVWVNSEFHTELKDVTGGEQPALERRAVPQPSDGIFARTTASDIPTRTSELGEDIDVASNGDVWFTQGGGTLYDGVNLNTSRIVRYSPSTGAFACYPVPDDDAEVVGVLLDEAHGRVWYSEGSLSHGNAIASFDPDTALSDCQWSPRTGARPPVCGDTAVPGCHTRYAFSHPNASPAHLALDASGNIWATEYWSDAVARLDPETGLITELPLPASIVGQGPGLFVGAGPWDIEIDSDGNIWLTEFFDATITRIAPAVMESADCTRLDASGRNPCVTEIYVGSDGHDDSSIHSLAIDSDGLVWFTREVGVDAGAQVGVIDPGNSFVALSPVLPDITTSGGISIDPANGAIWTTDLLGQRIVRFRPAQGDSDGIADALDNCPAVYNPGQQNADRNFVQLPPNRPYPDVTWANSDDLGDECDPDADNDGLPNDVEASLPGTACPTATGRTDPLLRDTDGDMVLDGAECALGSDPVDRSSYPSKAPGDDPDRDGLTDSFERTIGTDPRAADSDGDRVADGMEFKYYNTDPHRTNTDGDLCDDGREVASLNMDYSVNAIDLLMIAVSIPGSPSRNYTTAFDLNKDGVINMGDMALAAALFGPCR